MDASDRFEQYMEHLAEGLGHADRRAGLRGYCTGLMLPLSRKSVEPMAARVDPLHASAKHQALHHFVAKAEWNDDEMLRRVAQWVVPQMDLSRGGFWIIDDTGFPKQGTHSVGVARQYCGMLGKQDNCQVAVSVSLACEEGSLPVAWRLYLPHEWADDAARRNKAGVPAEVRFATKPQIALQQLEALLAEGRAAALRLGRRRLRGRYRLSAAAERVGIAVRGRHHLGRGRLATRCRATAGQALQRQGSAAGDAAPHGAAAADERQGVGKALPASAFPNDQLARRHQRDSQRSLRGVARSPCGRQFRTGAAATPGVAAHRVAAGQDEPTKYWLSTLPEDSAINDLVSAAHLRWRIERDYQDLKQEFGLGHYEGRGWRGFHHHASLCIAAYGFLMAQRLTAGTSGGKKNFAERQVPALPANYIPRGSPARAAPRAGLNTLSASSAQLRPHRSNGPVSVLRKAMSVSLML